LDFNVVDYLFYNEVTFLILWCFQLVGQYCAYTPWG